MCYFNESFIAGVVQWGCPDSPSFRGLWSLGWVGGSGIVEEALKICPARISDHAEAMLH